MAAFKMFFSRGPLLGYSTCIQWQKLGVRSYARIFHRSPIKVFTSEEAEKINKPTLYYEEPPTNKEKTIQSQHTKFAEQTNSRFNNGRSSFNLSRNVTVEKEILQEKRTQDKSKTSFSDANKKTMSRKEVKYLIKSGSYDKSILIADGEKLEIVTDKLIAERKLSSFMQNVKSTKARKASGKIFLEGERLIADAMKAGNPVEAIFFSDTELLKSLPLINHPSVQLYKLNQEKIQLWSDLTTSPGIMGIFDVTQPANSKLFNQTQQIPLTIICDNIRDPGNMGTLIRCAAAVGCKLLVTTSDCVDVWDSKVLRAAAGAHFRIKMALDVDWDLIPGNIVGQDTTVILADSTIQKGSISGDSKEHSTTKLLEVRDNDPKSRTVEVLEDGTMQQRDSSYLDAKTLGVYRKLPLAHFAYDELQIDSAHAIALVIGGETHGLSSAAHKLAHEFDGLKVYIPLENEVDSLNAGVAVGILAYEIRRLFLKKLNNAPSNSSKVNTPT